MTVPPEARGRPGEGELAAGLLDGDAGRVALGVEGDVIAARLGVAQLCEVGGLGDGGAGGLPDAQLRVGVEDRHGHAPDAAGDAFAPGPMLGHDASGDESCSLVRSIESDVRSRQMAKRSSIDICAFDPL